MFPVLISRSFFLSFVPDQQAYGRQPGYAQGVTGVWARHRRLCLHQLPHVVYERERVRAHCVGDDACAMLRRVIFGRLRIVTDILGARVGDSNRPNRGLIPRNRIISLALSLEAMVFFPVCFMNAAVHPTPLPFL